MARKKKSIWSKTELKKLRAALPDDWAERLAEMHQLSVGTVQNTLYGSNNNDAVVESALAIAKEHKATIVTKKEALANL